MKRRFIIAAASLMAVLFPVRADAQWEAGGSVSLSSSYIWAGNMYGAVGLEPSFDASYLFSDCVSFDASFAGYFDFGNSLYMPGVSYVGSPYNAADLYCGFTFGSLSLYAGDEYYIDGLERGSDNIHFFAGGIDWTASDSFPLTLSVYSVLHSEGDFRCESDDEQVSRQAHSTYISAQYSFQVGESLEFGPQAGLCPWQSPLCDYYGEGVSVRNVGLYAVCVFSAGSCQLPVSFVAGCNPTPDDADSAGLYAALSIGIEF